MDNNTDKHLPTITITINNGERKTSGELDFSKLIEAKNAGLNKAMLIGKLFNDCIDEYNRDNETELLIESESKSLTFFVDDIDSLQTLRHHYYNGWKVVSAYLNVNDTDKATITFDLDKSFKSKTDRIVTTVGIYPNNEYRTNGVSLENLGWHITYNLTTRPGRVLMVDGIVIYNPNNKLISKELKEKLQKIKETKNTEPYQ